jgi:hypothetical protein
VKVPIVDAWIRRKVALHKVPMSGFSVRVARTSDELEQAFRLVHAAYVWQGYESVRDPELRITPHHVLPEATVLVAYEGDQLVATMTVTADSPAGLPLEKDYPSEIEALRRGGARLVEYGSLAAVERCWHTGVTTLLNIAAYRIAREVYDATHCVIGINPKAAPFYRATYDYQPLGSDRDHAQLAAPVIGMVQDMLDVQQFIRRHYTRRAATGLRPYDHFLGAAHPCIDLPEDLSDVAGWKLPPQEFADIYVSRSDRLATLDSETRRHLAERRQTLQLCPA